MMINISVCSTWLVDRSLSPLPLAQKLTVHDTNIEDVFFSRQVDARELDAHEHHRYDEHFINHDWISAIISSYNFIQGPSMAFRLPPSPSVFPIRAEFCFRKKIGRKVLKMVFKNTESQSGPGPIPESRKKVRYQLKNLSLLFLKI